LQLIRPSSAILALAVVTVLTACGGPATAGGGAAQSAPPGERVQVTLTDFAIEPAAAVVHQHAVVFEVANRGQSPHNLSIRDGAGRTFGQTRNLGPGQSANLSVQLGDSTYTSFCSLPGHESLGMRGTVTVGG
jgi:uncharacterized cupredoxin-like copper-binding protein